MEVGINFFIALLDTTKKPQKPYKMTSADIFCPRSPPSCMSFIAFYSFIREILLYLHYTNP